MTAFDLIMAILMYFLPPLITTWALVVWLPKQPKNRKVFWATLISAGVMLVSGVLYKVAGGLYDWGIGEWVAYYCSAFLLTIPLVAGADMLLYSGGLAIRLHLSRRRVLLGYIMLLLGFLLWLVTIGIYLSVLETLPGL
jgi:hypothetical protein